MVFRYPPGFGNLRHIACPRNRGKSRFRTIMPPQQQFSLWQTSLERPGPISETTTHPSSTRLFSLFPCKSCSRDDAGTGSLSNTVFASHVGDRGLAAIAPRYSDLRVTLVADDLYAHQPFIEDGEAQKLQYILGSVVGMPFVNLFAAGFGPPDRRHDGEALVDKRGQIRCDPIENRPGAADLPREDFRFRIAHRPAVPPCGSTPRTPAQSPRAARYQAIGRTPSRHSR